MSDRDRVLPSLKSDVVPTAKKPPLRPPYRHQPHPRRGHRPRRNCCCFWTVLIVLILALLAVIAATALYVLYRPHRPVFSIPSLRLHRLNLTSSSSSNHVATLLNFTVTSKNPNSHITFSYDPFVVSALSSGDVFLGNGTVPGFFSDKKNQTEFRHVVVSGSSDIDTDSVNSLKVDLKKTSGVPLEIKLVSKMKVNVGKLSSKKVVIRVTCVGFKAEVPKGKSPSVASTDKSRCNVDLKIKIWKFTF